MARPKKRLKGKDAEALTVAERESLNIYGRVALDPYFHIAVGVFNANGITQRLVDLVQKNGLEELFRVVDVVKQLSANDTLDRDDKRLFLTVAHLRFRFAKDRLPTQKELLEWCWQEHVRSRLGSEQLTSKGLARLKRVYKKAGEGKAPAGFPTPIDRNNAAKLIRELALPTMDGSMLIHYRRLFKHLAFDGNTPSTEMFVAAARNDEKIGRRIRDVPKLRESPIERLLDLLALPTDYHPDFRWVSFLLEPLPALENLLNNRADLDDAEKGSMKDLLKLLFLLDSILDKFRKGYDKESTHFAVRKMAEDSMGLSNSELRISADTEEALLREFNSTREELRRIPSFSEFWLVRPGARALVVSSSDLSEDQRRLLGELSQAFEMAARRVPEPTVEDLSGQCPSIGHLAELFEEAHRLKETLVFYNVLTKDPELLNRG